MMLHSLFRKRPKCTVTTFTQAVLTLAFLAISSRCAPAQSNRVLPAPISSSASQSSSSGVVLPTSAPIYPSPKRIQEPRVESRALSSDSKMAASYSTNGTVTIWDVATGKNIRDILAYEETEYLEQYTKVLFSPNSKLLLTLGQVKQVLSPGQVIQYGTPSGPKTSQGKVWDVATGKLLWIMPEVNDGLRWSTAVDTIVWAPDSRIIASKARYGQVRLWNARTGKLMRTLTTPYREMDALAFSPDSKTLAGAGYQWGCPGSEIVLWNVQNGELERSLKEPDNELDSEIDCVTFSPDGKTIAAGGGRGQKEVLGEISARFDVRYGMVQTWDVKSGVYLRYIGSQIHSSLVTNLAFSPDGTRLATSDKNNVVGLWDAHAGQLLATATRYGTSTQLKTVETKPGPIGFQANEVFEDNSAQSWSTPLSNPKAPGTIVTTRIKTKVTGYGVQDLAFSRDSKVLNILSNDRTVRAWDISSPTLQSEPIRRLFPRGETDINSVAFAPDGHSLVSTESNKRVRFWSLIDFQESDVFVADDAVSRVSLAPFVPGEATVNARPSFLVIGGDVLKWKNLGNGNSIGGAIGFEVEVREPQSRELKHEFKVSGFSLSALAVSPGSRWIAAGGRRVQPSPNEAQVEKDAETIPPPTKGVVLLWDATTGEIKQKIYMDGGAPVDLAFSPNGDILASDNNEGGVTLFQTATGTPVRTFDDNQNYVSGTGSTLAFTNDGTRLARAHGSKITFWNVETGELLKTITVPGNAFAEERTIMALTPNGKFLATGSDRQTLKLWDATTGKILWESQEKGFHFLEMSPGGGRLATDYTGGIRLWNISQVAKGIVN